MNQKLTSSNSNRLNNYDALRIISTVAVIFIHVNWQFFWTKAATPSMNVNYIVESSINIIARFSVPAFVMISGAFNLKNKRNEEFANFYKKTSWKVVIPFIGVVLLLFAFDVLKAKLNGTWMLAAAKTSWNGIRVGNYYNLWFMYMLVGLYLFTPFIIKLRNTVSEKVYIRLSVGMLVWAVISQSLSGQLAAYEIGVIISFLSYYLIGDVILNFVDLKHGTAWYFCIAVVMFALTFVARYRGAMYYMDNAYTAFFSPFIVVASICVFAGVKNIKVDRDLSWLSNKTFYIYMFHSVIYTVLVRRAWPMFGTKHELLQIIVIVVLTFILSLLVSIVYDSFWRNRKKWKEGWYSLKIWQNGND